MEHPPEPSQPLPVQESHPEDGCPGRALLSLAGPQGGYTAGRVLGELCGPGAVPLPGRGFHLYALRLPFRGAGVEVRRLHLALPPCPQSVRDRWGKLMCARYPHQPVRVVGGRMSGSFRSEISDRKGKWFQCCSETGRERGGGVVRMSCRGVWLFECSLSPFVFSLRIHGFNGS